MTISAIIIVYNLEKFVDEAIRSVLNQTRVPDEIIVVDDCSTDNTGAIIKSYGSRIKYIRQTDNVGALRNTWAGVKSATGDVIAFLDGDDVWMPEKIAEMEKLFLSDDAFFIASHDHVRVNGNLELSNIQDETHLNVSRITTTYPQNKWSEELKWSVLLREGYWLGSAYCIRKKFLQVEEFEKITAQYSNTQWAYLDMVLGPFMVASNIELKVGFVNKPLFKYRVHQNNTSASARSKVTMINALNRLQYTNQLTCILITKYFNDPAIVKRYDDLNNEHQLMRLQYEGKKFSAIKKFFAISPLLSREKKIKKELFRLIITTFLGIPALTKLKRKYEV
jgi:glycosyltransferase involved in cell wall biosynthesis